MGGRREWFCTPAEIAAADASLRADLHHCQRGRCYLCNQPFGPRKSRKRITFEHVHPKSRRPPKKRDAFNRLLAHEDCNQAKGDRDPYPCELIYLAAANKAVTVRFRERRRAERAVEKPTKGAPMKRAGDDDCYPINFGLGSLHDLRDADPSKPPKKRKRQPMGFHIPPKPARSPSRTKG